jgi:hypothetical protein
MAWNTLSIHGQHNIRLNLDAHAINEGCAATCNKPINHKWAPGAKGCTFIAEANQVFAHSLIHSTTHPPAHSLSKHSQGKGFGL